MSMGKSSSPMSCSPTQYSGKCTLKGNIYGREFDFHGLDAGCRQPSNVVFDPALRMR